MAAEIIILDVNLDESLVASNQSIEVDSDDGVLVIDAQPSPIDVSPLPQDIDIEAVLQQGLPGASAYQVWLKLPGNAGRSIDDFFQSLRGPIGPPGPKSTQMTLPAGAVLLAYRAVTTDLYGRVIYCDASREDHADQLLGINQNAAAESSDVTIETLGPISNQGWSWTPDQAVFVGISGQLTQDPDVGVFCQPVGYARTPTEIIIRPGAAFIRG